MVLKRRKARDAGSETGQCLKEVYHAQGFAEAEVIRSYLESNGIRSVFKGTGAQSIMPQITDGMGAIQVCVLEKEKALAEELLKEFKNSPNSKK